MAFTEYEPTNSFGAEPIPADHASITRNGTLTIRAEDLKLANITDACVILIDELIMRLALRPPRPGDGRKVRLVSPAKRSKSKKDGKDGKVTKPGKWMHVNVNGALKAMNISAAAVAGRHPIFTKGDMIIFNFADDPGDEEERQSKRPKGK